MRTAFFTLVLVLGTASAASAQSPAAVPPAPPGGGTTFTPSLLGSFGGGATTNFGIGAQMRLDWYPSSAPFRGGGWASVEAVGSDTLRVMGGLEHGFWIFDCMMGVSYRTANDVFAGSLGLVLGKDIDFGLFSIGGRMIIPLADFPTNTATRSQGLEGMIVVTVGMPVTVTGATRHPYDCPCHRCHHGA